MDYREAASLTLEDDKADSVDGAGGWQLYERPGFLIRRLHQIHVNLFAMVCGTYNVTPLQYTVLSALRRSGPSDQTTISGQVFLDRVTTTDIIKRLSARGLIERKTSELDRRSQICIITKAGIEFIEIIDSAAKQAHNETLVPLNDEDRTQLINLMRKIVLYRDADSEAIS